MTKTKPEAASHGGNRTGAGRPPGARNKAKVAREEAANAVIDDVLSKLDLGDASRFTPLETLLLVMHTMLRTGNLIAAANTAKEAAPYIHSKIATTVPMTALPEDLQPEAPLVPDEAGPERPVL